MAKEKPAPIDPKLISVVLHEAIMTRVRNGLRSGGSGVACPECGKELDLDPEKYEPPPKKVGYVCPDGHRISLTYYKE